MARSLPSLIISLSSRGRFVTLNRVSSTIIMHAVPDESAAEMKLGGESADPEGIQAARKIALSYDDIQHVNEILTLHMGPEYILLNSSVDFDDTASAGEVEKTVARLGREIKKAFPRIRRIFVEAEDRTGRVEV